MKNASTSLRNLRIKIAADASMQDIMDHWKKEGYVGGPAEKIKWMIEELGISQPKAEEMMQEYSRDLAAKGRESLTRKREQQREKLKQHVDRAKYEIENPTTGPLPLLPGMEKGSSYKLKISTVAKSRSFQKKHASQDPRSSSFSEKLDILLDYIENFPSALAAAQNLLSEAKKLLDIMSNGSQQQMTTANLAKQAISVSGVVAKVNNFLWILTALALYGAAGTSDYIAKHGSGEGLSEAKAFLIFLTSLSASILSSVLYKFIMDRKAKPQKQKSLYEGFNK
jgi:hypothetical protein